MRQTNHIYIQYYIVTPDQRVARTFDGRMELKKKDTASSRQNIIEQSVREDLNAIRKTALAREFRQVHSN